MPNSTAFRGSAAAAAIAVIVTITSIGLSTAAGAASAVSGLAPGWTFVTPGSCMQLFQDGLTSIYIYPESGGVLWSNEFDVVTAMEDPCTWHVDFQVYSDGVTWQAVYFMPGDNDH